MHQTQENQSPTLSQAKKSPRLSSAPHDEHAGESHAATEVETDGPRRLKREEPSHGPPSSLSSPPGLSKESRDRSIANTAATIGWSKQKQDADTAVASPPNPSRSRTGTLSRSVRGRSRVSSSASQNNADAARAALLAVGSPSQRSLWSPKSPQEESWINSAANQAFKTMSPKRATFDSEPTNVVAQANHGRSLAAAKDAMSATRPRSISSPVPRSPLSPGLATAAAAAATPGALSAATMAHRPATKPEAGGVSPVVVMARDMYTSNPPLQLEVEEKRLANMRHAAAADMARGIYLLQQRNLEASLEHAQAMMVADDDTSHSDDQTIISGSVSMNLQQAAYNRAQKRLEKLKEELGLAQRYQDKEDVDAARRGGGDPRDRNALMDAARRNVQAQIRDMDEKVLAETGRIAPSLRGDWEVRAQAIALAKREARNELESQVDIGGGKFISRDEVNAIALKRVQPLLEDLQEKARIEREKQELHEVEQAARRVAKEQEHEKRLVRKNEAKEAKAKAKEEERAKRQERLENGKQKRLAKDERPSRRDTTANADKETAWRRPRSADDGSSPTRKVKTWLKSRLPIRHKPGVEAGGEANGEANGKVEAKGFMGGKALRDTMAVSNPSGPPGPTGPSGSPGSPGSTGPTGPTGVPTTTPPGKNKSDSQSISEDGDTSHPPPESGAVSPLTSSDDSDEDRPATALTSPPPKIMDPATARPNSPGRDSRFREMLT